jgi:hypothetical protein
MHVRSKVNENETIYGCDFCGSIQQRATVAKEDVGALECRMCERSTSSGETPPPRPEPEWDGQMSETYVAELGTAIGYIFPAVDSIALDRVEGGVRVTATVGEFSSSTVYEITSHLSRAGWIVSQEVLGGIRKLLRSRDADPILSVEQTPDS